MSHYEIGMAGPAERFSLGPLKDEWMQLKISGNGQEEIQDIHAHLLEPGLLKKNNDGGRKVGEKDIVQEF